MGPIVATAFRGRVFMAKVPEARRSVKLPVHWMDVSYLYPPQNLSVATRDHPTPRGGPLPAVPLRPRPGYIGGMLSRCQRPQPEHQLHHHRLEGKDEGSDMDRPPGTTTMSKGRRRSDNNHHLPHGCGSCRSDDDVHDSDYAERGSTPAVAAADVAAAPGEETGRGLDSRIERSRAASDVAQRSLLLLQVQRDADRLMARQCRMTRRDVVVVVGEGDGEFEGDWGEGDWGEGHGTLDAWDENPSCPSGAPEEERQRRHSREEEEDEADSSAPSSFGTTAVPHPDSIVRTSNHDPETLASSNVVAHEQYHYVVMPSEALSAAASRHPPFYYVVSRYPDAGDMSAYSSLKDSCADPRGLDEDPSLAGVAPTRPTWRQRHGSRDVDCEHGFDQDEGHPSASDVERATKGSCHRAGLDDSGKGTSPESNLDDDHNDLHVEGTEDVDDEDDNDGCTWSGAPDSDFSTYRVKVNPDQDDRAVDIPLYSMARPHMRAFHMSWMAFFVAFFVWFGMSPLLGEIASTLNLTHEQVWTSSCLAVASSAVTRVIVGPLTDMFGARRVMAITLVVAAIPTALAGAIVHGPVSLYLVRSVIGIAGSAFVTCQYWTSRMFTAEIAGTANALVAGWGNLGGGVAQIVVGSILFPLFKLMYGGSGYTYHTESEASTLESRGDDAISATASNATGNATSTPSDGAEESRASELAWRTVLVLPALLALATAWAVLRCSDDTPKGRSLGRRDDSTRVRWSTNLWDGVRNRNTIVLFAQYACCFGCELALFNAAALYFAEEFGQSTEAAAALASVFGWTNLFARGVGGFCSDMANAKSGMRGRLYVQSGFLVLQGVLIMAFAVTHTLAGSILTMILFCLFLQASEGSTFAIVPYVLPEQTGSVTGWVGAGGNVGGVCFTLLFRSFNYQSSFMYMGAAVSISAVLTVMISIPGHRSLLCGQDSPIVYEHRRRAKLPQAVAFVRPGEANDPPGERPADPTLAGATSKPADDYDDRKES